MARLDVKNLVVRTDERALNSDEGPEARVDEATPDWSAEMDMDEVIRPSGASLYPDRADSTAIVAGLNIVSGKPMRKHWIYVWNPASSRYVVSGTYPTPK